MKEITIIIGANGSGKTTLLKQMLEGKNYAIIKEKECFPLRIEKEIDIIAIDEAVFTDNLIELMMCQIVRSYPMRKKHFDTKNLELIITSQSLPKDFKLNPLIKIINL